MRLGVKLKRKSILVFTVCAGFSLVLGMFGSCTNPSDRAASLRSLRGQP